MRNPKSAPASTANLLPFASMAGGWLAPMALFWLAIWGPLRPFDYPQGALAPPWPAFVAGALLCVLVGWLPPAYYRVHRFERSGLLYEWLGVRLFRRFVPDGDLANRWKRRSDPQYRVVRNRRQLAAFARRNDASEKGHLVLLVMGFASAWFAARVGWHGWAWYLAVGNVLVNLYPVLLQRYTRARIARVTRPRS